jgi:alkylhydroperoxidase family enzyme
MLKLFQSFFGGDESRGRYPESLVEEAIERAVDATDSRLRLLPGYRKRLREPVIHAIDHVVALVDAIPAPVAACRDVFSSDPRLAALFVSAEQMLEMLGRDRAMTSFLREVFAGAERLTALLMAERIEKNVLGMELAGEQVRRDVVQLTVSFRNHRLVDVADNETETRRQLKRRAFDHLLSLALARIVEVRDERTDLAHQRDVLRHKLLTLNRNGWSFEEGEGAPSEPAGLQAELDDVESQLQSLGSDTGVLATHLDIVVDLLGQAEQQLQIETVGMRLDSMNIQRDAQDASARDIVLQEIRNARGRSMVLLLVSVIPGELPPQENLLATAHRYL